MVQHPDTEEQPLLAKARGRGSVVASYVALPAALDDLAPHACTGRSCRRDATSIRTALLGCSSPHTPVVHPTSPQDAAAKLPPAGLVPSWLVRFKPTTQLLILGSLSIVTASGFSALQVRACVRACVRA